MSRVKYRKDQADTFLEKDWRKPGRMAVFIGFANLLADETNLPSPEVINSVAHGGLLAKLEERFSSEFSAITDAEFRRRYPTAVDESEGEWIMQGAKLPLGADVIKRKGLVGPVGLTHLPRDWWGDKPEILYSVCYAVRYTLEAIAAANEKGFIGFVALPPSPYRSPGLWIIEPGLVQIDRDPYLQDFLPELPRHDLSRVRRCPVCSRFLWASRVGKKYCSEACSSTERTRRFRTNQPKYEKNRMRYRKQGFKAKERIQLSASLRRAERETNRKKTQ
jgi:hypothetical protein